FQIEPFDKIDLGVPTVFLEGGLADVIFAVWTRKGEIVGQYRVKRTPILVLFFPRLVPTADDRLICRGSPSQPIGLGGFGKSTVPARTKAPVLTMLRRDVAFAD